MTQQSSGGGASNRKAMIIAALVALLIVAIGVWLISRAGRDDNLTPDAVAVDPTTGELSATGTAALDATGTDTGAPGTPGVYNEDSTGGAGPRTGTTASGVGATGAVSPSGAMVDPATGVVTPPTGPAATPATGAAPAGAAPPQ